MKITAVKVDISIVSKSKRCVDLLAFIVIVSDSIVA